LVEKLLKKWYNTICKLKQVVFERRQIMLIINKSRDTIKKHVIGLIIANAIDGIGLVCTAIFLAMQAWIAGLIAYAATCIGIAINIR